MITLQTLKRWAALLNKDGQGTKKIVQAEILKIIEREAHEHHDNPQQTRKG